MWLRNWDGVDAWDGMSKLPAGASGPCPPGGMRPPARWRLHHGETSKGQTGCPPAPPFNSLCPDLAFTERSGYQRTAPPRIGLTPHGPNTRESCRLAMSRQAPDEVRQTVDRRGDIQTQQDASDWDAAHKAGVSWRVQARCSSSGGAHSTDVEDVRRPLQGVVVISETRSSPMGRPWPGDGLLGGHGGLGPSMPLRQVPDPWACRE